MEPKVNYTVVGLFVVLLGAILLGIVLWLSKGDYRGTYDRYYAYMRESVSGLSVNSPVKYRGVEVGRVKEIVLSPENPEEVRLTLDIARGTPVMEDTLAVLDIQGLTGLAIVNLAGGSRTSSSLTAKAGEPYPVIKSGPSLLYRLDTAISRLLADQPLTGLLTTLTSLAQDARGLVNEENRAALKQTLADLATVTHTVAAHKDRVDQGISHAAQSLEHLAKLTQTMNEQLPPLIERVGRIAGALEAASKEMARTSSAVGRVVNEAKPNVEQFSRRTLAETGLLVSELRQLTASLQRLAGQLEREPNALIFGKSPEPRGPGE